MPYIPHSARPALDEALIKLVDELDRRGASAGDLNYVVTCVVQAWLQLRTESYASYNTAIGVLEAAKLELYRRQVARYEEQKLAENGDVYLRHRVRTSHDDDDG